MFLIIVRKKRFECVKFYCNCVTFEVIKKEEEKKKEKEKESRIRAHSVGALQDLL